jgi:hypothetical protein
MTSPRPTRTAWPGCSGNATTCGPAANWPKTSEWEEGLDLTEADDEYAEVHPYAEPRY